MKLFIGLVVIAFGIIAGWYTFSGGRTPSFSLPNFLVQPTRTPNQPTPSGGQFGGKTPTPTKAVGVFQYSEQPGKAGTPADGQTKGGMEPTREPTRKTEANTVQYTESGFAPASLSVIKGTVVTFINDTGDQLWVVSDYNLLPKLDGGKNLSRGQSYQFTFDEVGTWRYQNKAKPEMKGIVIVR